MNKDTLTRIKNESYDIFVDYLYDHAGAFDKIPTLDKTLTKMAYDHELFAKEFGIEMKTINKKEREELIKIFEKSLDEATKEICFVYITFKMEHEKWMEEVANV